MSDLAAALKYDPFQGEEGHRVRLSDRISRARYSHKCVICWGLIAPGRRNRVMREIYEGKAQSHHICIVCCRAMIGHIEDRGKRIEAQFATGQQRARDFYTTARKTA